MGIKKTLCALILPLTIGLVGCVKDDNKNSGAKEEIVYVENKPLIHTPEVFNKETNKFNQLEGGISEDCLNQYINSSSTGDNTIEYYQKVDEQERKLKFIKRGKYEGGLSNIETLLTAIENMKLISEIDKTNITQLKEEYVPLKKIIMELNKIDDKKISQLKKAEEMIEIISQSVESGKETRESVGIEKLVNGELGDCNDLSPTYFAILNYYGIKAYMRSAAITEENKKIGLHAWININVDDISFDLDPTWYEGFCPLEDRDKEIEHYSLKDKFMTYKK